MRRPRFVPPAFAGLAGLLVGFTLSATPGCGPDPVGVEDCREIEQARCEAGTKCGIVRDVAACQRFYRDHCLHGLAVEEAPQARAVTRCAETIRAIGVCASNSGPDSPLLDCMGVQQPAVPMNVCEAVSGPEELPDCRFLVAGEPETPDGAGGSAGAAPDAAGGSGGVAPDAAAGSSGASGSDSDGAPE